MRNRLGPTAERIASVRLDADFADIVNTGMEYHVFPVPNGECKGLYVTNKTASGFEVRELAAGTQTSPSSIASWPSAREQNRSACRMSLSG